MAFLRVAFLISGPLQTHMQYFLDHVRSITTDFGVEMSLVGITQHIGSFLLLGWRKAIAGLRGLGAPFLQAVQARHTRGGIMKAVMACFLSGQNIWRASEPCSNSVAMKPGVCIPDVDFQLGSSSGGTKPLAGESSAKIRCLISRTENC